MEAHWSVELRCKYVYMYVVTVVTNVLFRAGLRRALGLPTAHHRAHVWAAQIGNSPTYLWLWWLLAVTVGDGCLRTGLLDSWAEKGVGAAG